MESDRLTPDRSTPGRPEADRENVRTNILKVALELFSGRGYEGVGVQEIVDAAGITKPALYYYFGSKAGLLETLLVENFDLLDATVSEASVYRPDPAHYERDVMPTLLRICRAYFDFALAHPDFFRMQLALTLAPADSEAARAARGRKERQFDIVRSAMHSIAGVHGNVRKHEQTAAAVFVGIVNTYIVLFYGGHGRLDEETAKRAVRFFMHGLFA